VVEVAVIVEFLQQLLVLVVQVAVVMVAERLLEVTEQQIQVVAAAVAQETQLLLEALVALEL
jgi:hypothetical protein